MWRGDILGPRLRSLGMDRQLERAAKKLGGVLKERRLELDMTQEDVAFAMDIAVRHYQKLEAGRLNVTLRTLVKASKALRLDLRDLFGA